MVLYLESAGELRGLDSHVTGRASTLRVSVWMLTSVVLPCSITMLTQVLISLDYHPKNRGPRVLCPERCAALELWLHPKWPAYLADGLIGHRTARLDSSREATESRGCALS